MYQCLLSSFNCFIVSQTPLNFSLRGKNLENCSIEVMICLDHGSVYIKHVSQIMAIIHGYNLRTSRIVFEMN